MNSFGSTIYESTNKTESMTQDKFEEVMQNLGFLGGKNKLISNSSENLLASNQIMLRPALSPRSKARSEDGRQLIEQTSEQRNYQNDEKTSDKKVRRRLKKARKNSKTQENEKGRTAKIPHSSGFKAENDDQIITYRQSKGGNSGVETYEILVKKGSENGSLSLYGENSRLVYSFPDFSKIEPNTFIVVVMSCDKSGHLIATHQTPLDGDHTVRIESSINSVGSVILDEFKILLNETKHNQKFTMVVPANTKVAPGVTIIRILWKSKIGVVTAVESIMPDTRDSEYMLKVGRIDAFNGQFHEQAVLPFKQTSPEAGTRLPSTIKTLTQVQTPVGIISYEVMSGRKRRITSLGDLNGVTFGALIFIVKDNYDLKCLEFLPCPDGMSIVIDGKQRSDGSIRTIDFLQVIGMTTIHSQGNSAVSPFRTLSIGTIGIKILKRDDRGSMKIIETLIPMGDFIDRNIRFVLQNNGGLMLMKSSSIPNSMAEVQLQPTTKSPKVIRTRPRRNSSKEREKKKKEREEKERRRQEEREKKKKERERRRLEREKEKEKEKKRKEKEEKKKPQIIEEYYYYSDEEEEEQVEVRNITLYVDENENVVSMDGAGAAAGASLETVLKEMDPIEVAIKDEN